MMAQIKLGGAKKAAGKIGISVEQYLQNVNSGLKWCIDCRAFVDQDYFYDSSSRDGKRKHTYCKSCSRVRSRRTYELQRSAPDKLPKREIQSPRDGDKQQARRRVNQEVAKGKLPHVQAVACTDCGHIGSDRKHHYDHYLGYAAINHLTVQCVCILCHQKRERQRCEIRRAREMTQKETVVSQHKKLYEVKEWLFSRLREEDDRQVRDALFAATQACGLAMLNLEMVEYLTVDRPNYEG